MDIWSPLPQLEAVFYRRNSDKASAPFEYHNHILMGAQLMYIEKPLQPKDVGKFRLVLVQGTKNGRLCGIKLNPRSEVNKFSLKTGSDFSNSCPTSHIINVSGVDPSGNDQQWQLAIPSEAQQIIWYEALCKARDSSDISEASGEYDKLRDFAIKMKNNVGISNRLFQFKFYPRTFVGSSALRWIRQETDCTVPQALAIGNKLLNSGFIHHVDHSHFFCAKTLLYRFSKEIDPLAAAFEANKDSDEAHIDSATEQLYESYQKCRKELKVAQFSLKKTQRKEQYLNEKLQILSGKHNVLIATLREHDFMLTALLISYLVYEALRWVLPSNSTIYGIIKVILALITTGLLIFSNVAHGRGAIRIVSVFVQQHPTNAAIDSNLLVGGSKSNDNKPTTPSSSTTQEEKLSLVPPPPPAPPIHNIELDDDIIEVPVPIISKKKFIPVSKSPKSSPNKDSHSPGGLNSPAASEESVDGDLAPSAVGNATSWVTYLTGGDNATTAADGDSSDDSSDDEHEGGNVDDGVDDDSEIEEEDEDANFHRDSDCSPSLSLHVPIVGDEEPEEVLEHVLSPILSEKLAMKAKLLLKELGPPAQWSNTPLLLRRNASMIPPEEETKRIHRSNIEKNISISSNDDPTSLDPLKIHGFGVNNSRSYIAIDNSFFTGKAHIIIANMADSPADLFRKKQRKFQYLVQGRFKRRTPYNSVYTGQAFSEPLLQLPAMWLLKAVVKILAQFQPALQLCLSGDRPYLVSPLMSTCQNIVVSSPGSEPDISMCDIEEDLSCLGAPFDKQFSSKKRKTFFSKRSNLLNYHFETDVVYTFDFYQHVLNFSTFQFDFGFLNYDIVKPLGARPLQIMAMVWDPLSGESTTGSSTASSGAPEGIASPNNNNNDPDHKGTPESCPYLYNFEVWHQRCIPLGSNSITDQPSPLHGGRYTSPVRVRQNSGGSTNLTSSTKRGTNSKQKKQRLWGVVPFGKSSANSNSSGNSSHDPDDPHDSGYLSSGSDSNQAVEQGIEADRRSFGKESSSTNTGTSQKSHAAEKIRKGLRNTLGAFGMRGSATAAAIEHSASTDMQQSDNHNNHTHHLIPGSSNTGDELIMSSSHQAASRSKASAAAVSALIMAQDAADIVAESK